MSRRLQQHAAHCTCSECTSRSLNGQNLQPHAPEPEPPPPLLEVSGAEIALAALDTDDIDTPPPFTAGGDIAEDDEKTECDVGDDDNGPHSGAV